LISARLNENRRSRFQNFESEVMPNTWKVLNITLGHASGKVRTVDTAQAKFEIHDYSLGTDKTLEIIWRAALIGRRLKQYDVTITSEYFASFAVNLRLALTFCRTKHVTVGLNRSRRILKTGLSLLDKVINRIFCRGDLFFVHSRHEISLFADLHHIPPEKFCFLLWGFDVPKIENDQFDKRPKQYICMIGRNNRDIETFCQAADGLDVDAILVTSQHQNIPDSLPANVHVYTDLSMEDCLSCIKHSCANLILVKDDERGAGHITAVAAMLLGTPQIVSDAQVLSDYFVDRYNCIKVPMGDFASVRSALEVLLTRSDLAGELALNGIDYASGWLTHGETEARTFAAVGNLLSDDTINQVDPIWEKDYANLLAVPALPDPPPLGSQQFDKPG
jgi:hypothetical protein